MKRAEYSKAHFRVRSLELAKSVGCWALQGPRLEVVDTFCELIPSLEDRGNGQRSDTAAAPLWPCLQNACVLASFGLLRLSGKLFQWGACRARGAGRWPGAAGESRGAPIFPLDRGLCASTGNPLLPQVDAPALNPRRLRSRGR